MRNSTSGITASAAIVTVTVAGRQPWWVVSDATSGRKMSCPVAFAAVRMPLTSPRRATNQRVETVATKAIDIEPVPRPTSSPQHSSSCQLCVMNTVSPLPAATRSSATHDHRPDAEAVHQGGRERRHQPEQRHVDRHRRADGGVRPAELHVQRIHEHARDRTERRRAEHGHEGHRGDEPGPVQPPAPHTGGVGSGGQRLDSTIGPRDAHPVILGDERSGAPVAGLPICARILPCTRPSASGGRPAACAGGRLRRGDPAATVRLAPAGRTASRCTRSPRPD